MSNPVGYQISTNKGELIVMSDFWGAMSHAYFFNDDGCFGQLDAYEHIYEAITECLYRTFSDNEDYVVLSIFRSSDQKRFSLLELQDDYFDFILSD